MTLYIFSFWIWDLEFGTWNFLSCTVLSNRFAVTNFNWNLTGFPWPSNESMISRTSHNRIKVEFMGAIVIWWVGIIKDSIFAFGGTKKNPGFPGLALLYYFKVVLMGISHGSLQKFRV